MICLILLPLTFSATPYETPPMVLWSKSYGGYATDIGHCVLETPDSGLLVAGWTYSFGAGKDDAWLLKTDPFGDTLWMKTYGGAEDDFARSVFPTSDSAYVVVGYTSSFGAGNDDVWLLKINEMGDTLWTKTYGCPYADYGRAGCETSDSCYVIAGSTTDPFTMESNIYIIKTDRDGNTVWTKTYGEADIPEQGYSICETPDSGYMVVGTTKPSVERGIDVWLLRLDKKGDTLWTKTYGGNKDDVAYCLRETSDGGYIIVGWTYSYGAGESDIYLIKTDESGELEWQETYGDYDVDEGYTIVETSGRGYITGGYTFHMGVGNQDAYLLEIDIYSDTMWTKTYGGDYSECAYNICPTYDDGYIVTGFSTSSEGGRDLWLAKLSWEESIVVKPDYRMSASPERIMDYELYALNYTQIPDVIEISYGESNSSWSHWIADINGDSLTDTDSDSSPDVGEVDQAGGGVRILAMVEVPEGAEEGTRDTFIVYGRSSNNESLMDSAVIITTVLGQATLWIMPDQEGFISPENPKVRYGLEVISTMVYTQTGEITFNSTRGWPTRILQEGSDRELEDTNDNDTVDIGQLTPGAMRRIDVEVEMTEGTLYPGQGTLDTLVSKAVGVETTVVYVSTASDGMVRDSAVLVTSEYALSVHNFPNPFENVTRIVWCQPEDGEITIRLADRTGRLVTTVYEGTCQAGLHSHLWKAEMASDEGLAPGIYVIIVDFKTQTGTRMHTLSKTIHTGR